MAKKTIVNSTYELDYLFNDDARVEQKRDKDSYPALTKKNADFIEGVVRIDSNYRKDFDKCGKPDEGFDPFSENRNKYYGSTAYWFDRMISSDSTLSFRQCVMGAIISIDSTNSTHLEAGENAREELCNRICNKYKNVAELKAALEKDYKADCDHLLYLLTDAVASKKNKEKRYNLSFASKFCSYAAKFLNTERQYSKYDAIVAKNLWYYVAFYLNCDDVPSKNSFSVENTRYKEKTEVHKYISVYEEYCNAIDSIIDKVNCDCPEAEMDKEKLDHIIWYGCK